ncbi:MAG TPA: protein kinase, partial [Candidatus Limnocylindrales bacterium]
MAGEILAGRYELGERLGVGGMSTVVSAFDERLEREVAIKLLAEHLADDSQFVARFRREALAAARLVHPNIVQVFDFGLDQDSHRHYIVMELIRGQSGAEILRDERVLDIRDALSIVAQACRGLEYAHRNGVVHRDVKPGNLLRNEEGVVKLADFGIAKAISEESSITQVGSVLGTAAYLAPEQAAGEQAGPAADLYALGVVTYQLLSGRLPYEAQSLTELALKQQRELPPRLDELNPAVPPQLAMAVDGALALDPRQRPASADEFRHALADGARGIGPDPATTRIAGPATTATSVLGAQQTATNVARAPVQQRQPRAPREPRPAPAAAPPVAAPAARRRPAQRPRRRARRVFGSFLVLLLLAAGGAAAVIATSTSDKAVHLRRVVYDDVNQG